MTALPLRSIYQIKITLTGLKPPIWRTLQIPSTITLDNLHLVLQIAMGWTNSHLHQYVSGHEIYSLPDDEFDYDFEIKDESQFKVSQLLKKEKDTIQYEYDFGDGWLHKIVLEKILPFETSTTLPRCIRGKRNCPPEDCGGVWGYNELLETLQDPSHPEYQELTEWLGEDFDPEYVNIKEINQILVEYYS